MPTNYVLINEYTTSVSVASVTLSNIPTTGYTDLKLVVSGRLSVNDVNVKLYFNADSTASNYSNRRMFGDGTGGTSSDASTATLIAFAACGDNNTASTFGNAEIYFPNYSVAGLKKTYWTDNVTENNGTTAYATISAMLWQGTAAISSITMLPNTSGNFVAGCTFALYGIAALGTTPTVLPKATGGDIIVNDGTYWYHAFLSTGVFTPSSNLSCDAIVVGGGGAGGGGGSGGGGGAGGIFVPNTQSLIATNYTVTVGAGGVSPANGNDSQFGSLTLAKGGGAGSIYLGSGGSGGGGYPGENGGTVSQTSTGGTGYGNVGGNGGVFTPPYLSGGGGGAGSAGANGVGSTTGAGGAGLNTWSSWLSATGLGVSGFIAGGGGGGANQQYPGGSAGVAGSGGAGTGGISGGTGTAGVANTGSGGGGSSKQPSGAGTGGSGGSGLVIVRYSMA